MWRSRDRSRNRSGGRSLLSIATAQLGTAPLHYWDFAANRALFNGVDVGAITSTPGWGFSRATVGTAEDLAGNIIQFASGQLRRTDKGVLIEETRINLFLNSAVGVTQNITVAAVAYTLSFRGTGTITLTGTSTAGPLVGTGTANRVTLTFTPTAGTLTLTVTGSCTNVQRSARRGKCICNVAGRILSLVRLRAVQPHRRGVSDQHGGDQPGQQHRERALYAVCQRHDKPCAAHSHRWRRQPVGREHVSRPDSKHHDKGSRSRLNRQRQLRARWRSRDRNGRNNCTRSA